MINMSRTCATAALAALLFACVDPAARLDDFSDRVIDAGDRDRTDAAVVEDIPDATGTFLLSLAPFISPDEPFQFLAEVTVNPDEAVLDITVQPLDVNNREPIGDAFGVGSVTISSTTEFDAIFAASPESCSDDPPEEPVRIPGAANPVSGSDLLLGPTLHGLLIDENRICGRVTGCEYSLDLDLDSGSGSTFAAIRVDPGTEGDDLPEPVGSCAGLPDESE